MLIVADEEVTITKRQVDQDGRKCFHNDTRVTMV